MVSLSSRASVPLFLVLAFLLLSARASPLRHKGLLVVDVFFCFGEHLEMENIRSLDCMPSPAIKVMMANFSSGMSTFNDSELNLWT